MPGSPDYKVYRANADHSVDVFLPNLGRPTDGPWRWFHCTGLSRGGPSGFELTGCTDPVDL